MIIDNLKQELTDNYVQNANKVMDLFTYLGPEPYNCISPNNPENKKIIPKNIYATMQTKASRNTIYLSTGTILYKDSIIPAIIQKSEDELTYFYTKL